MEMKKISHLFAAAFIAAALTACGSSDTIDKDDESTAVDISENGGASAHGTGDEASLEGSDIIDTNSDIDKDSLTTTYYFAFDSNSLNSGTRAELDNVATFMKTHSASFKLLGHADERGTREYNLALSERRAKSIEDYLALQGIARSRIEVIGFGEEKPANPESSEAAYQENRRVELDH